MGGLFVTGTDTGVGKTVVTAALVHALRREGVEARVWKPVQSGARVDDPNGDAATLVRLGELDATPGELCLHGYEAPVAPAVAARHERGPDAGALRSWAAAIGGSAGMHLVEGAGGLIVPLAAGLTVADLARELGFPILVVARPGLGTVNHTALTVEAARSRGLFVAGVVLNGYRDDTTDPSVEANAGLIEELASVPVLARTPWVGPEPTPERVRSEVAAAINARALLARPAR